MEFEQIKYAIADGAATITLNRPQAQRPARVVASLLTR